MFGTGLVKGYIETARNFIGSYTDEARLTTVEYPEERIAPKENSRQFPFLVFDGADAQAGLRCVACQICEKECPPKCIYIVKDTAKKPDYIGKLQFQPKVFDIDVSVCMSCQICVEVCPFEAIKMDQAYELSRTDRFEGLLQHKTELAKPNSYFHEIHPTDATEVDTRLAVERKAAAEKAAVAAAAKVAAAAAKPAAPANPAPSPAVKPQDEPRHSPQGEGGPAA